MLIRDREIVQVLQAAGCQADPGRGLVKIHRPGREALCGRRVVTLCGKSREHDLQLGDGKVYARTPGGATRILDLETGRAREATQADVADCVRLADALPNIHGISMCQVVPMDVPRDRMDLTMAQVSLANTGKHLFYVCHNDDLVEAVIGNGGQPGGGL
jgi:trimethylamine--corrinoid protein Co-methyltransferase